VLCEATIADDGVSEAPMPAFMAVFLALWAALLFGGFLFGKPDARTGRRMPRWTRLGSSLVLASAASLWFLQDPNTVALLIAAGMTLGLLGDFILAGVAPGGLRGGMAAFGLGHLSYIAAFLLIGARLGLSGASVVGAAGFCLVAGGAGWFLSLLRGRKATALRWAALPYALLLTSTLGVAAGLAAQNPALWPLALGGILFLASDATLAARRLNSARFPLIEDFIWLTYGPAQACIVFGGMAAALPLLP
jgi:uncharacterized membrane protein YhhN